MRETNEKNLKALVITLIIIAVVSVLSPGEGSPVSAVLNGATRGLFQITAMATASADSASPEQLLEENRRLKEENAALRAQLADYLDVKSENEKLGKLLKVRENNPSWDIRAAKVIKRDANDDYASFTLDIGTADGVRVNNAVITENGLVGRVSQADALTCKVETILSPETKAAAADKQSKDTGIVSGNAELSAKGLTSFNKLAENHKVKKGDMTATSGEGGAYPGGLLIGEVVSVEFDPFDAARYAVIKPYEDVSRITSAAVIISFDSGVTEDEN